ncbi:MAG: hypothetical protein ABSE20_09345 [Acetobacteraceae bacterium]|jgi:hypothetical protein
MRLIWSVALLLVCHAGVVAAAGSGTTASEISAEIDAKGAKAVIERLSNAHVDAMGQNDWSRTMDQIWNGRLAYIALAPKLARGADGTSAEDLGIALARALPVAPEAVLRVIDRHDGPVLGVSRVCGVPFAEPSTKDVSGYVRAARSAVGEVDTPRLQHVKAACLEQLTRAAKQLDPRQGS